MANTLDKRNTITMFSVCSGPTSCMIDTPSLKTFSISLLHSRTISKQYCKKKSIVAPSFAKVPPDSHPKRNPSACFDPGCSVSAWGRGGGWGGLGGNAKQWEWQEKQQYAKQTRPQAPNRPNDWHEGQGSASSPTDGKTSTAWITDRRTRSTSSGSQTVGRRCRTRWAGPRFCRRKKWQINKHGDIGRPTQMDWLIVSDFGEKGLLNALNAVQSHLSPAGGSTHLRYTTPHM